MYITDQEHVAFPTTEIVGQLMLMTRCLMMMMTLLAENLKFTSNSISHNNWSY